jgi:hypothetical protein
MVAAIVRECSHPQASSLGLKSRPDFCKRSGPHPVSNPGPSLKSSGRNHYPIAVMGIHIGLELIYELHGLSLCKQTKAQGLSHTLRRRRLFTARTYAAIMYANAAEVDSCEGD